MDISESVKLANKDLYDNKNGVTLLTRDISTTNLLEQIRIARLLRQLADWTKGKKFLDVGTGCGNVLRNAQKYFKHALGCDLCFYPISILKKENASLPLVCAEAERLPFKDSLFDVVCIFSVLHHIVNYDQVIEELGRMVRKGGYLYIDHETNYFFIRNIRLFLKLFMPSNDSYKKIMFANFHSFCSNGLNPELIKKKLIGIGFSNVDIEYRFTYRSYGLIVPALRLVNKIYPFKSCYTHFAIIAKK